MRVYCIYENDLFKGNYAGDDAIAAISEYLRVTKRNKDKMEISLYNTVSYENNIIIAVRLR